MHQPAARFRFSYGSLAPLMRLMGLGPRRSVVEVTEDAVRVRMGWGFRASVPRRAIRNTVAAQGPVGGIGVHGSRGRWLVNGSDRGLVVVQVEPPGRARVTGWPVTVRELVLSLEQPDQFIAALAQSAT